MASANHALHQHIRYGSTTPREPASPTARPSPGEVSGSGEQSAAVEGFRNGVCADHRSPGAPAQTVPRQSRAAQHDLDDPAKPWGAWLRLGWAAGATTAALAQAAPPAPGPQMAFRAAADDAAQASNLTAGGPPGAGAAGQPGTGAAGMAGLLGLMQDPNSQNAAPIADRHANGGHVGASVRRRRGARGPPSRRHPVDVKWPTLTTKLRPDPARPERRFGAERQRVRLNPRPRWRAARRWTLTTETC